MRRRSIDTSADALAEAVSVHAHLQANGRLLPVEPPAPGLTPEPGEYAVGVFAHSAGVPMTYARYYAADVVYVSGRPAVVVGTPQFVTGYAIGSVIRQTRGLRRARREAAAQWRACPLLCTVVTTCRIWCSVVEAAGPRWLNFNYDTITDLRLDRDSLTISFAQSEPLRLSGPWAPWCAVVAAHYTLVQLAPFSGAGAHTTRGVDLTRTTWTST